MIGDGPDMGEEVEQEPPEDSNDDTIPEMTIEERKGALKKSRWNVFMYLGLAALFFGFALYPFMGFSLHVEEGTGSIEKEVKPFGLDIPGEGFSDIPVEIEITTQSLPTDVKSIEVFMIENSKGCSAFDGSIESARDDLRQDKSEHPNAYHIIEEPVESHTYDLEFEIDTGIYCMQVVAITDSQDFDGINVEAQVEIYPLQLPLAIVGIVCLILSGFAFIGAQKHGKFVKSLIEPKEEQTLEETVLAQTSAARISAGPGAPPVVGPSGPPGAPPSGPPAPSNSESAPLSEAVDEVESEPVVESDGDIYEDQGDGWFFRKFPDGTYDQDPYMIHEGHYIPYVDPDA